MAPVHADPVFTHSVNKFLLSTFYIPGTVSPAMNTTHRLLRPGIYRVLSVQGDITGSNGGEAAGRTVWSGTDRWAGAESRYAKPQNDLTHGSERFQFIFLKDHSDCCVDKWLCEVNVEQRNELGGCSGLGERWQSLRIGWWRWWVRAGEGGADRGERVWCQNENVAHRWEGLLRKEKTAIHRNELTLNG